VEFDDSKLRLIDRDFLRVWAEDLKVPVSVLLKRILTEAVKGGHYIIGIPDVPRKPHATPSRKSPRV
jgi:hypothetical protein